MGGPAISVSILNYQRRETLARCLERILAQDHPGFETLVVDNASTDGTGETLENLSGETDRTLRVVREETLGLSTARNTGFENASGRVVIFLDDDATPWRDWLPRLLHPFQDDAVYAAGGPVRPAFATPLPDWFSDRFLPYLTVWDLGPEVVELRYNEYPRGANMAFRREVFDRFGFFSPHLGRKARSLLSCEEIELCLRIERGGGSILYVPEAGVDHRVEGDRVSPEWLRSRFRSQGTSEAIVEWQHAGFRGLAIGLKRSLRRAAASSRAQDPEQRLVSACERATARGYLLGMISAPVKIPRYRPAPEAGPAAAWEPFR